MSYLFPKVPLWKGIILVGLKVLPHFSKHQEWALGIILSYGALTATRARGHFRWRPCDFRPNASGKPVKPVCQRAGHAPLPSRRRSPTLSAGPASGRDRDVNIDHLLMNTPSLMDAAGGALRPCFLANTVTWRSGVQTSKRFPCLQLEEARRSSPAATFLHLFQSEDVTPCLPRKNGTAVLGSVEPEVLHSPRRAIGKEQPAKRWIMLEASFSNSGQVSVHITSAALPPSPRLSSSVCENHWHIFPICYLARLACYGEMERRRAGNAFQTTMLEDSGHSLERDSVVRDAKSTMCIYGRTTFTEFLPCIYNFMKIKDEMNVCN